MLTKAVCERFKKKREKKQKSFTNKEMTNYQEKGVCRPHCKNYFFLFVYVAKKITAKCVKKKCGGRGGEVGLKDNSKSHPFFLISFLAALAALYVELQDQWNGPYFFS